VNQVTPLRVYVVNGGVDGEINIKNTKCNFMKTNWSKLGQECITDLEF